MTEEAAPISGRAWGDSIGEARQDELRRLLDASRQTDEVTSQARPFAGVALTGADVYWLITQLGGESGPPTRESDEKLDLRGADLSGAVLKGATLRWVRLDGALLIAAHFERVYLADVSLQGASIQGCYLQEANLSRADLQWANLTAAHLEGTILADASLGGSVLVGADLTRSNLSNVLAQGADFRHARLNEANLANAVLDDADLSFAHAEGADFSYAHMLGAHLAEAKLDRVRLHYTRLDGAFLAGAQLDEAELTAASFDKFTVLAGSTLPRALLDMAIFDDTNLTMIKWGKSQLPAEVRRARATQDKEGQPKSREKRAREYSVAARTCHRLVPILQANGMNEVAARFALQGQTLQRAAYRHAKQPIPWLASWFFALLAGYGYRPGRPALLYLATIAGFAVAYYLLGPAQGHTFRPDGALVFSVTSFHGRGFFPESLDFESWVTRLAALEAVLGLLIEISFIATFTQRFFGSK